MKAPKFSEVNRLSLPFAACWYAMHGFRVFPCSPDKTPLVSWSLSATDDLPTILAWWKHWPQAGIGIAMGNGWHALDLDQKNGGDD